MEFNDLRASYERDRLRAMTQGPRNDFERRLIGLTPPDNDWDKVEGRGTSMLVETYREFAEMT